jgi:hypothetical protein
MDHPLLIARLASAKRRVKLGQDQIDRQRMVVATLFAAGSETTEAENRLRVYEKLHRRYLVDMERILIALDSGVGALEIQPHRRLPAGQMPAPERLPPARKPIWSPTALRRAIER